MNRYSNTAISKIARRVFKDPTSATTADVEKLARAWLLASDGTLPK